MRDLLLTACLWGIMFAIGTSLEINDFRNLFRNRHETKALLLGMASLFLVVPLLDIAISLAFHPEPAILFGLVLLATVPGGILSNVLTDLAKGNVALSVSLSIAVSAIYILLIPLIVALAQDLIFGHGTMIAVGAVSMLSHVAGITALPTACGMLARPAIGPRSTALLHEGKLLATGLLVALYVTILWDQHALLARSLGTIIWIVAIINLANPIWALTLCRLARLSARNTTPIVFEHVIRQEGTAIFVATALLHREAAALPLIVNSLFGIIIGGAITSMARRRTRSSHAP